MLLVPPYAKGGKVFFFSFSIFELKKHFYSPKAWNLQKYRRAYEGIGTSNWIWHAHVQELKLSDACYVITSDVTTQKKGPFSIEVWYLSQ